MDHMPVANAWQKKFSFYAASLLRQGNFVDAGFVAAILFEQVIENELLQNGMERPDGAEFLFNSIEMLSRKDPNKYSSANLHTLRKIRERHVIHSCESTETNANRSERELIKAEIARLVTYVWQALDLENFIRYRTIGTIPLDDADNAVMEVRDFFLDEDTGIAGMQERLEENDFNDLRQMRQHLFHLSAYLKKRFLPAYCNLEIEVVGKADNTSAYAWMVVNLIRPWPVQRKLHVHYASAAVMATPLELRIYLDFGREAYMSRGDWYSFVETDIFRQFVDKQPELQIFDTEWYSFVTATQPAVRFVSSDEFAVRVEEARKLLAEGQEQHKVLAWGRILPGFIMPRSDIGYEKISSKLEKIVWLYYLFEKYRRDVLKRNNTLEWVPKGI